MSKKKERRKGIAREEQQERPAPGIVALHIIFLLLLVTVFLRPLVSGMVSPWSKCAQQLVILAAVLILVIAWMGRGVVSLPRTPLDLSIVALVIFLLISSLRPVNPERTYRELAQFLSYLGLYYLLVITLRKGMDKERARHSMIVLVFLFFWLALFVFFYLGIESWTIAVTIIIALAIISLVWIAALGPRVTFWKGLERLLDKLGERPTALPRWQRYVGIYAAYCFGTFYLLVKGWGPALVPFFILWGVFALIAAGRGRGVLELPAEERGLALLVLVILLVAIFVSGYGIHQSFLGLAKTRELISMYHADDLPTSLKARIEMNNAFSTFVLSTALAGYLVLVIPLAECLAISGVGRGGKALGILTTGICLFCLYLTGSKGGWICFLATQGLLLVLLSATHIRRRWYLFLGGALAITAIFLGLYHFHRNFAPFHILGGAKESLAFRLRYWEGALGIMRDYPVRGVGLDGFGSIMSKYKSAYAEETQKAHNNYLQMGTDTGWGGMLSFVALWILFFRKAWPRAWREGHLLWGKGTYKKTALFGVTCGLAGFCIHSLVDFGLLIAGIATIVWVFLAVGITVSETQKSEMRIRVPWVVTFLLFLAVAGLSRRPIRTVLADQAWGRGDALYWVLTSELPRRPPDHLGVIGKRGWLRLTDPFHMEQVVRFSQEQLAEAAEFLRMGKFEDQPPDKQRAILNRLFEERGFYWTQEAIRLFPEAAKYRFRLGEFCGRRSKRYREGSRERTEWVRRMIESLEEASRLDPYMPHYHAYLGRIYWGLEEKEKAIREFELARDAYPTKPVYRAMLGYRYQDLGRKKEAAREYECALALAPTIPRDRQQQRKQFRVWYERSLKGLEELGVVKPGEEFIARGEVNGREYSAKVPDPDFVSKEENSDGNGPEKTE